MINEIELNDSYINKIMLGTSDLLKVRHKVELDKEERKYQVVLSDLSGIFFTGIVKETDKGYVIVGDNMFKRIYPTLDKKTGKIISLDSEE